MFENLSDRLERSFKLLKGQGKITEINVAETLKDVRRALVDADVNYKVAKNFTDTVKQKAIGQNVINAIKPSERHSAQSVGQAGHNTDVGSARFWKNDIFRQTCKKTEEREGHAPSARGLRRLPSRRHRPAQGARGFNQCSGLY